MSRSDLILVIDDDRGVLSTVKDVLEFNGYSVRLAATALQGLQMLEQLEPRLVLLDMRMPVMDGWDFIQALEEKGGRPQVPVVVMTAAQDAERSAQEVGAQGYLAKPFDMYDLLSIVEAHVESNGSAR